MLRFSINPNSELNLNDLRIALFNHILSKQLNEELIIRIENDKNSQDKDREILELLNLFSIDYKMAYYESDSLKYHQKLAMQLMSQKKAFACFCGEEKLKELKKYDDFCSTLSDETVLNTNSSFTVRIKNDDSNNPFDSFVILNHDKSPTSNYACAIDDMINNISTVINLNKNDLDNKKQTYIRSLLSYTKEVNYINIEDIKVDEKISIKSLIEQGFLPIAIANYLVLLGNDLQNEIFTLEEAVKWFDINKLSKEKLNFDINKLKEINKTYLEKMDDMRLSKILGFADEDIGKLAKLFLKECDTINEIKEKIKLIFEPKNLKKEFEIVKNTIQKAPFFDDFNQLENYLIQNTSLSKKDIEKPLNYLLTGKEEGIDILSVYPLIKNYLGEILK